MGKTIQVREVVIPLTLEQLEVYKQKNPVKYAAKLARGEFKDLIPATPEKPEKKTEKK